MATIRDPAGPALQPGDDRHPTVPRPTPPRRRAGSIGPRTPWRSTAAAMLAGIGLAASASAAAPASSTASSTASGAASGSPSAAFEPTSCEVRSPARRLALVELYTSEGCSSCPPAEGWLSALADKDDGVVPLALHVTYWDYLGWTDPYAKPAYTARQRTYAALRGSRSVYTPQVVLAGADFPRWSQRDFRDAVARIRREPAGADIALVAHATGGEQGTITLQADIVRRDGTPRPAALYVALYDDSLVSDVRRGENAGATLRHDRVVRQLMGPIAITEGTLQWREAVPLSGRRPAGIAAFVQTDHGEVLQATACRLP